MKNALPVKRAFSKVAEQLATVTDAGLGLFVMSKKTGAVQIYEVGDFRVEMIIPEPSISGGLFALAALFACLRRRRA